MPLPPQHWRGVVAWCIPAPQFRQWPFFAGGIPHSNTFPSTSSIFLRTAMWSWDLMGAALPLNLVSSENSHSGESPSFSSWRTERWLSSSSTTRVAHSWQAPLASPGISEAQIQHTEQRLVSCFSGWQPQLGEETEGREEEPGKHSFECSPGPGAGPYQHSQALKAAPRWDTNSKQDHSDIPASSRAPRATEYSLAASRSCCLDFWGARALDNFSVRFK